jgi:peptide/nickel transport system substrate-binding protein
MEIGGGMIRAKVFSCLILASVVAACGGGRTDVDARAARTDAPSRGGSVVVGVPSDVQNWNPYLDETAFGEDILSLLYPTLAVEQVDYLEHPPSFAPGLARSWEWSADHRSLTFHLDERARWDDGEPVTSEDVLFSWKVQTAPEIAWSGATIKAEITAVEAIDRHTVQFRFARVYPYQMMDANDGPIVPAHLWRAIPFEQWPETDWTEHAASAGPFRLARHAPQQEIVLERNPSYWHDGLPRLDRVVFRIVPSQSGLVTQLRSGEIDMLSGIPPRDAERLANDSRIELIALPGRSYTYVGWNTRDPRLAEPRVRRALGMAINRAAIVDSVLRGWGRPSIGPVLSEMWAFDPELEPLPFNPDDARRILAEAGWHDGNGDGVLERADGTRFEVELLTNHESDQRQDVCLLVAADLARVGVRVEPRFVDWGTLLDRQERGDFAAYVSTWREGTQVDLWDVWHSSDDPEETYNYVRYANPEVDRLLEAVAEAPDAATQKPLLFEIQEHIVADQPYTFLYEAERLVAVNRRVRGAVINDATPYFNIESWWVGPSAGSGR